MTIGRLERSLVRGSIGALALAMTLGGLAAPATLAAQGRLRELWCRGGPGLSFRVDMDPSPRDTTHVVMEALYRRSTKAVSGDAKSLEPGTCSWNLHQTAGIPVEPGSVRLDLKRVGQPWPAKDTTIKAGAWFPDPVSLPRYLGDSRHYYKFFVDDATRFSSSFGAVYESAQPVFVMTSGPLMVDPATKREIRCRGGTGLMFGGGGSVGPNLASVTMSYRVSATVPGQSGSGLTAGSCAWVDRTGVPREPGKVTFTTASNAQLKQIQSGSTVDRSPTAAAHYPDVTTIPVYLQDPARYWTFTVTAGAPDKASTHGAWIPPLNLATTLETARRTPGATTLGTPTTTGTGSSVFRPGAGSATTTSRVNTLFDIRNVSVTAGLEGVVIRFEAAANSSPVVTITPASVGATTKLTVASSPGSGGMMRYVAASSTKLPRGMSYNYGILAAATGNARQNSTSGTFKTLSQQMTIHISEINLISDGDADSDGELIFTFHPCTPSISGFYLSGRDGAPVSWGDGRQWVVIDLKSRAEVPDQVRVLVSGDEDDTDAVRFSSRQLLPKLTCARPNRPPGRNSFGEWNSLVMDFDLTKHPGSKAGENFVRRSQPLSGGSRLMFEIRGYWEVTRK
jgi:hypothetical protein